MADDNPTIQAIKAVYDHINKTGSTGNETIKNISNLLQHLVIGV